MDGKAVKDQLAERFVKYFAYYCGRYGIPKTMVTDNAKQFDNRTMEAIRQQFGTFHKMSPAGNSQGNAICERAIESLNEKLATIVNNANSRLDWEMALPIVLFSMNSKVHSSTGYAPFELLYGRAAPLVQSCARQCVTQYDLYAEIVKNALEVSRANAIANNSDAQASSKRRFDDKRRDVEFELDEKVLIQVKSRSPKLGPKFDGPFRVTKKERDIYELENINDKKDKRRRHVSQMKKFTGSTAALLGLLMLLIKLVAGTTLEEALPIMWEESKDLFVSEGEETMTYLVHFTSLCGQIYEFARILNEKSVQRPINNNLVTSDTQQNRPLPPLSVVSHQTVIQPQGYIQQPVIQYQPPVVPSEAEMDDEEEEGVDERRPRYARQIDPIHQLVYHCESMFNHTIKASLIKFDNARLDKRQLALITGYVISNIVQEI